METSGESIRQALHTMLTQAEIDLDMWLAMRKARADKDVSIMLNRRYGRFCISAENAFFNALVTILYCAFEKRKDTANFWSLRDMLPENADPEIIREIDNRYTAIKAIWKRVSIVRNEVVGHQTLKRTKSQSHEIAGMTVKDLKEMVKLCQELLFQIASKFQDTHVVFNLRGAESFENLIADLRSNNSLQGRRP